MLELYRSLFTDSYDKADVMFSASNKRNKKAPVLRFSLHVSDYNSASDFTFSSGVELPLTILVSLIIVFQITLVRLHSDTGMLLRSPGHLGFLFFGGGVPSSHT